MDRIHDPPDSQGIAMGLAHCGEIANTDGEMRLQDETLHFDAVKERNSRIITTAGAVVTVVEDPALSILEKDSYVTEPSRNVRSPCLKDDAASPGTEFLVKHLISHMEVGMPRGLL